MAKYFGLRGRPLNAALIWAVIMPAYILFGYNNGVAGGLLALPSWISTFPRIDTETTSGAKEADNSRVQGTVVAMYTLGCFFGALSCIWIGDRLGRIRTILVGACIEFIGVVIQASSFSLAQLIVGRLVTGLGFGALTATAPNWQSECSKANHRGSVVLLEGLFISFGLAVQAWVNYGMSHTTGSISWRLPLALSGFFALIVIGNITFMPESPRWLVKKGRVEEARQVLSALSDTSENDPQVLADIEEIEESLAIAGQTRFKDLLTNDRERLFQRTAIAAAGQCFQQMSGINALAFYLHSNFETGLGLGSDIASILSACVFTWQTICSPIGVLTVDRFGRRKLMLVSAFGMGCCMAIISGTSSQTNNSAAIATAGAFIFLFSLFFPTGFLGLTFLYAAEIAPLSARVLITSISTGSAWIFNFLVAEVTPVGFATITYRYYIIYACINFFLIIPVVYFFFPETNGKHLEEVDRIFLDSKSFLDPVKIARRMPKGRLHEKKGSPIHEEDGEKTYSSNSGTRKSEDV